MDMESYTRFALTLLLVLGLIFVVAALLRRFGPMGPGLRTGRAARRRLQVVEAAMLDPRRRLLLVRRDDREHLLLIGGTTDLVVERDITPPEPPETTAGPTDARPPAGARSFRALLDRTTGQTP
jgi:flagellar protein FliO/FliZ